MTNIRQCQYFKPDKWINEDELLHIQCKENATEKGNNYYCDYHHSMVCGLPYEDHAKPLKDWLDGK